MCWFVTRSRCISNRPRLATVGLALAVAALVLLDAAPLAAQDIPPPTATDSGVIPPAGGDPSPAGRNLYLEIFINGISSKFVASVLEDSQGGYSMDPKELRNVGILPIDTAKRPDGRIDLARLPNVIFATDENAQTLSFTVTDKERATRVIDVAPATNPLAPYTVPDVVTADFGALLNYSISAVEAYGADSNNLSFGGLAGTFEGRLFGPMGILDNSFSVAGDTMQRLDTTWSYSDPSTLRTYRAGDIITGGLSWTRPTRLGGLQIESNFGLRPDLVTLPVPGFAASAAVPSTVEVYLNNTQRYSDTLPAGPFEISDLPVATGPGTSKIIVRDANGNEIVTTADYFISDRLLRPGLADYSAEIGFPRRGYGTAFDNYSPQLMGSGSVRYGLTNALTLEGHAEGGMTLANLGMGAVAGLGRWGVVTLAADASSTAAAQQGLQLSGSLELQLGGVHLEGQMQQTFGDYNDIASVTAQPAAGNLFDGGSGAAPRSLAQVSLSMPVPFDSAHLNLSYTQLEAINGHRQRLAGLSIGRPLFGGSLVASGYANIDTGDYGVLAGLSMPIGKDMSASAFVQSGTGDASATAAITRSPSQANGNYGWQARHQVGGDDGWYGAASARTPVANVYASANASNGHVVGAAEIDGAVVVAGGGVFLSSPIDDAFAIVDAGTKSVPVSLENREIGTTGSNGKLLIPGLHAYQRNRVSIDPANLPLDADVNTTRLFVVPADRAGVVVSFTHKAAGGSALVAFRNAKGGFLDVGALGRVSPTADPFLIGYDGQAYIEGLAATNHVIMQLPDGSSCAADFPYAAQGGAQVTLPDVTCISP